MKLIVSGEGLKVATKQKIFSEIYKKGLQSPWNLILSETTSLWSIVHLLSPT